MNRCVFCCFFGCAVRCVLPLSMFFPSHRPCLFLNSDRCRHQSTHARTQKTMTPQQQQKTNTSTLEEAAEMRALDAALDAEAAAAAAEEERQRRGKLQSHSEAARPGRSVGFSAD